jgi:hypothetical protein
MQPRVSQHVSVRHLPQALSPGLQRFAISSFRRSYERSDFCPVVGCRLSIVKRRVEGTNRTSHFVHAQDPSVATDISGLCKCRRPAKQRWNTDSMLSYIVLWSNHPSTYLEHPSIVKLRFLPFMIDGPHPQQCFVPSMVPFHITHMLVAGNC